MALFKRQTTDLNALPVPGILLTLLFTIDVFFFSFLDISKICGGIFFSLYRTCFSLLFFLHIYPGIFVIPGLSLFSVVHTFLNRKNKKYLKHCGLLFLWCLIVILTGIMVTRNSSGMEEWILNRKLSHYERIVAKIQLKERSFGYKNAIGDSESNGDLAFFQYATGPTEDEDHNYYLWDYYILYSRDIVCDIPQIKADPKNEPLYRYDGYQLERIKDHWYRMEVRFKYW